MRDWVYLRAGLAVVGLLIVAAAAGRWTGGRRAGQLPGLCFEAEPWHDDGDHPPRALTDGAAE